MKMYLLSVYQPDGPIPPPDVLSKIMQDVEGVNRELKASNSWVFRLGYMIPRRRR
jgi:hypothetical protein